MPIEEHKVSSTHSLPLYSDELPPQSPSLQFADFKNDTEELNEDQASESTRISSYEWILLVAVFLVASATRVYKLERTVSHGVRFNADTLALPKLLAMLTNLLQQYTNNIELLLVDYSRKRITTTRLLATILGALTAPLTYLTTRLLESHPSIALLASLFIAFDNGLILQSRHIFPDTILFFFTSLSLFLWFAFTQIDKRQPFSQKWWSCLVMTGLSLGAVVSCKWTGMFTAATIVMGIYFQVLAAKGEKMRHLKARVLCLVVLPTLFYLITQRVYIVAVPGGLTVEEDPSVVDVSIGSTVTIRSYNSDRGYLHSHNLSYPSGSKQQQITLYSKDDTNSKWIITNATADAVNVDYASPTLPITRIFSNTQIRLRHLATPRNLHSHQEHRVGSKPTAFEVTGYGMSGFAGDDNDNWTVEIRGDGQRRGSSFSRFLVRTKRSVVAFRHPTGCYLYSSGDKLPEWGLGQLEVTCNHPEEHDLDLNGGNALWYFESSDHPAKLVTSDFDYSILPPAIADYLGIPPEARVPVASANMKTSESWFFPLNRGVDFRVAPRKSFLFTLNPIVWRFSIISIATYLVFILSLISRLRRGDSNFDISSKAKKYITTGGFLFLAWAMHYVPYNFVDRKLFIYDYFPALYISLLLLFMGLDTAVACAGLRVGGRTTVVGVMIVVLLWSYGSVASNTYDVPSA